MRLLSGILGFTLALAAQPVPTRTIMDILSSSPQFSELVKLIQHHELVPLINNSWNSTLLAPVNSAFVDIDQDSITRDQLLYHLINATAYSRDFTSHTEIYHTYLDNGEAIVSLSLSHGVNNEAEFDDLDLLASPQRGLVHSLSNLLDIPPTLSKRIYLDRHLTDFSSFIDDDVSLKACTVFSPASDAITTWLEDGLGDENSTAPLVKYLQSPFGKKDRRSIVSRHVFNGLVNPGDSPQEVQLSDGTKVTVFKNFTIVGPGFRADAASNIQVARNGLYIEIDRVLAENAVEVLNITPEKFIIGLGGYSLVRALTLYGHRDLIDGTKQFEEPRTIIVPIGNEEMPQIASSEDAEAERNLLDIAPKVGPSSLILYQFLQGELPEDHDSHLLYSHMPLRSGKSLQRVHFERRQSGTVALNWEVLGANAYQWGNNTFYTSEELLAVPPSLTMALGPLLISSFSLSFLDKLNRLQLPVSNSWTLFVPTRDAWENSLLLKQYLDSNEKALARVFDNLILQSPVYSDSEGVTVNQFNGIPTYVSWNEALKEFYLKNSEMHVRLEAESTDALFDNGVAHIVNSIPLPYDLEISTSDLIKSGDRSYFLGLLAAAQMSEVLEPAANFTILVPPPHDLLNNNYTVDTDIKKLQAMLKLHLIPNNHIEDLKDGESAITLAGEKLAVQAIGPFGKFWGLSPESATNGQRVLLYESGRTNGVVSGGSSVMFIDRHISPQWIIPIHFGLRKGTYAIFGVLFGLVFTSSLVFGLVWLVSHQHRDSQLPDIESPIYHDDDEEEPGPEQGQAPDSEPVADGTATSGPIETPGVADNRAYGRHLNLPE